MPFFKSWKEIEQFKGGPTVAEKKLKAALESGRICKRGPPDKIPAEPNNWSKLDGARHIRADVLRFLLVHAEKGGVQPHELGLQLDGAYISGLLDLDFCKIPLRTSLRGCRFEKGIDAEYSDWSFGLRLENCAAPSFHSTGCKISGQLDCEGAEFNATEGLALNLHDAKIKTGLLLRNAKILGTAYLSGLQLGGQMDCEGAEFNAAVGHALELQSAEIKADLFLRNTKISGTANLSSLQLGSQMDCEGAEFNAAMGHALDLQNAEIKADLFLRNAKISGTARLSGLQLGGQLECDGAEFNATEGDALDLENAEIEGGLFLREIKSFNEILNLTAAKTSTLVDDADSIQLLQHMSLDGFTYDRIIGPTDSKTRLRWLERGDIMNGEFAPQPYKQLAKVLHDMGHEADATTIRVALAKKLAAEARKSRKIELNGDWKPALLSIWYDLSHPFLWLWHFALSLLTDFGYRPAKSVAALLALWMVAVCPAHLAWEEGSFAPNSGPILTSPDWMWYSQIEENPADTWSRTLPGKDWETFNRYAYAADLVIPIIDLGQTDAWAPSTERGLWGYHLWWLRWVFTIAGWIVTALGAAALTGIIRRE